MLKPMLMSFKEFNDSDCFLIFSEVFSKESPLILIFLTVYALNSLFVLAFSGFTFSRELERGIFLSSELDLTGLDFFLFFFGDFYPPSPFFLTPSGLPILEKRFLP